MAKFYDKLLFGIGLLALLAGLAIYLTSSVPDPQVQVASLTGSSYQAVTAPGMANATGSWTAPIPENEQQNLWDFRVFTPPKVYLVEGVLSAEPPEPPGPPPQPFGLRLVSIEQEEYRLRYEGYLEIDPDDASKSIILMVATNADEPIRTRVGRTDDVYNFEVLDFEVSVVTTPDGNIERRGTVTILDRTEGQTVRLTSGTRRFSQDIQVTFVSTIDPSESINLSLTLDELPKIWQMNNATYTLTEIDLENSSATVEKESDALDETLIRTVSVRTSTATPPSSNDPTPDASEPVPGFDGFTF